MLNLALVGLGFMAATHIKALREVPGARVAALCNPSGRHLDGDFTGVAGNVGDFSAFMAQEGRLVVCGDAGDALGDSLYEAVIYVRGQIKSLGADAHEEPMSAADHAAVADLLGQAGLSHDPKEFRRVASMRSLYHWNADANQEY